MHRNGCCTSLQVKHYKQFLEFKCLKTSWKYLSGDISPRHGASSSFSAGHITSHLMFIAANAIYWRKAPLNAQSWWPWLHDKSDNSSCLKHQIIEPCLPEHNHNQTSRIANNSEEIPSITLNLGWFVCLSVRSACVDLCCIFVTLLSLLDIYF